MILIVIKDTSVTNCDWFCRPSKQTTFPVCFTVCHWPQVLDQGAEGQKKTKAKIRSNSTDATLSPKVAKEHTSQPALSRPWGRPLVQVLPPPTADKPLMVRGEVGREEQDTRAA